MQRATPADVTSLCVRTRSADHHARALHPPAPPPESPGELGLGKGGAPDLGPVGLLCVTSEHVCSSLQCNLALCAQGLPVALAFDHVRMCVAFHLRGALPCRRQFSPDALQLHPEVVAW